MKKTYFASALMLALTSGTLFAQTLVTVNGQAIDSSVIDDQVASVRASNPNVQDTPELRQMLTERQVISTVIPQEAKKLNWIKALNSKLHWSKRVPMPPSKVQIKKPHSNRMGSFRK